MSSTLPDRNQDESGSEGSMDSKPYNFVDIEKDDVMAIGSTIVCQVKLQLKTLNQLETVSGGVFVWCMCVCVCVCTCTCV